jgi:transportin-3
LEAVQALYHHPDHEIRKFANDWLEDFQYTVDAWQVSDSVLHDQNSTIEALYFCAQTLRTKVQRDFEELPPNAPLSLRDSLMTLLVKFREGPGTVRTQLCLAMVALAVQLPSDQWGTGGVVHWLGSQLGAQPAAMPCFLELVTVLPQVGAIRFRAILCS